MMSVFKNGWVTVPGWVKWLHPPFLIWEMPESEDQAVYITFDDGPNPEVTPWVLEHLSDAGAKATFFCVGANVEKFPKVYDTLLSSEMKVGNHTFNHINGWKTRDSDYLASYEQAQRVIESPLFRPPYGKIKYSQIRMLQHLDPGIRFVMWSILSRDFDKKITSVQCLDNVINNIKPGSVIIFHDSLKARVHLEFALPRVLEFCQKKGWAMKALP
jgi:peptidoglycan-N-acetylglucosamine deacetylase